LSGCFLAGLFLVAALLSAHTRAASSVVAADYVIGCACAVLLYALRHDRAPGARTAYSQAAGGLAGFSYTLYVSHMPLLVFLRAALVPGEPWRADAVHMGYAGVLTAITVTYAIILSRLTEAHTDRIRTALLRSTDAVRLRAGRLSVLGAHANHPKKTPGNPEVIRTVLLP
jgi:peptidoglycan/LPS O-acetylase OafA/YrhL